MDRLRREAGRVARHQERRHPASTRATGTRHHERNPGDVAVGDEDLRPVQPIGVTLLDRRRLERGRVGSVIGLGQAEAAERLAGRHPRQPLLLLLGRAPAVDRAGDQAEVDREDRTHIGIAAAELLDHQAVGQRVGTTAAVLLRDRQPDPAVTNQAVERLLREALLAVVADCAPVRRPRRPTPERARRVASCSGLSDRSTRSTLASGQRRSAASVAPRARPRAARHNYGRAPRAAGAWWPTPRPGWSRNSAAARSRGRRLELVHRYDEIGQAGRAPPRPRRTGGRSRRSRAPAQYPTSSTNGCVPPRSGTRPSVGSAMVNIASSATTRRSQASAS